MKKITLCLLIFTGVIYNAFSQGCLPDGITFYEQTQVDNFQQDYPGCTEIEGNVWIIGNEITDLSGLNTLSRINGFLEISVCEKLENLAGLTSLTEIQGELFVFMNPSLKSLSGLDNITTFGQNLGLFDNDSLTDISALFNCSSDLENIYIRNSPLLTSLHGLEQVSNVTGDVWIKNTGIVDFSGMNNLKSIGGEFQVYGNVNLVDFDGLNNLESIGSHFFVMPYQQQIRNESLVNFNGLENLSSIGETFWVEENDVLHDFTGLDKLESVMGTFYILNNASLKNLDGLEKLSIVVQYFGIIDNELLESVTGLVGLTSFFSSIRIEGAKYLKSLDGLENLNPDLLTGIALVNNDSLSNCAVKGVCDYLASSGASVSISGNAPNCNSKAEVLEACALDVSENQQDLLLDILPNPVSDLLYISHANGIAIDEIRIFDFCGREVLRCQNNVVTDVSALVPGLYFADVSFRGGSVRKQFVKQ